MNEDEPLFVNTARIRLTPGPAMPRPHEPPAKGSASSSGGPWAAKAKALEALLPKNAISPLSAEQRYRNIVIAEQERLTHLGVGRKRINESVRNMISEWADYPHIAAVLTPTFYDHPDLEHLRPAHLQSPASIERRKLDELLKSKDRAKDREILNEAFHRHTLKEHLTSDELLLSDRERNIILEERVLRHSRANYPIAGDFDWVAKAAFLRNRLDTATWFECLSKPKKFLVIVLLLYVAISLYSKIPD